MTGKGDPAVPRQQWPQCGGGKCDFVTAGKGIPAVPMQQGRNVEAENVTLSI